MAPQDLNYLPGSCITIQCFQFNAAAGRQADTGRLAGQVFTEDTWCGGAFADNHIQLGIIKHLKLKISSSPFLLTTGHTESYQSPL